MRSVSVVVSALCSAACSRVDGEELPVAGNAFELVFTAVLEVVIVGAEEIGDGA